MAEPIPINFPVPLWVVMEYIAPDNYDKGPIYSKAIGAFTEETSVTSFLDNLLKRGAYRFESQPISGAQYQDLEPTTGWTYVNKEKKECTVWVVQTQTVLKLEISLGAGIASAEVKSDGGVSGVDQSRLSSGLNDLTLKDGDGAKTVQAPSGDDPYYASVLNSARKVSGGKQ